MIAARPVRAEATPDAISQAFSFTLLSGRDAPGAARHAVADETRDWLEGESTGFALALLISEGVTNAVTHGSAAPTATVVVEGTLIGRCLGIEVTNAGPPFEYAAHLPAETDLGGRGLGLVDALAARWGAFHLDGSTTVWFECEVDASGV